MKISDIGEFGLIDRITRKTKDESVLVGIGDDAAVIETKKGMQVLTTDCLVEGDHFHREWFSAKQIGMKSIEINVSDVAAMGAVPRYALVSLALPNDLDVKFVEEIYKGMWASCDNYKIDIIGGNMAHSDKIVLSITLIGEIDKKNLSLRARAKPGDLIFVSGHLGNGRAGLQVFQHNLKGFNEVRNLYLEPKAKLHTALTIAPYVNAMIDVSDGLAPEIHHICEQSTCGAILFKDNIPISDEVRAVAKVLDEDAYQYALFGGEDFELVFTVSQEHLDYITGFLVGEITKKKEVLLSSQGKETALKKSGYDHFL